MTYAEAFLSEHIVFTQLSQASVTQLHVSHHSQHTCLVVILRSWWHLTAIASRLGNIRCIGRRYLA